MSLKNPYAQRRFMRSFDKLWTRFEGFINRFTKSDFNPFYHLGTLTIYMLIVLIATGAYLTIIYRPGLDVAYGTVEKISSNWFGLLIRSVHRYASDAMIVLILLHFLKMMFSDRYWGPRWLAWTSGWIMLAATWLTGTFGYWLIWDRRAQWMTEYMMDTVAGSEGLTYVSPTLASTTFSNFVIILFLHVFIPLIGFLGIYIHVLRLSRARWWAPRWVAIQATIGLVVLSLIKPAMSAMPADLGTMVTSTPMDAYYLGFLPLIDQVGNWIFWILAIFLGGFFFLLPWLASGRDLGPALVTDEKCTGCVLCYAECPYDAIRMVARTDDSGYQKLAVINNAQCTGCGICVGSCPTDAIDLKAGYNGEQTFSAIRGALKREKKDKHPVTVLFASQRDEALNGLPESILSNKTNSPISVTEWGTSKVITAILPSISSVNIAWIKTLRSDGARDVVLLSSPYDDNLYREDAHWISNRLRLRPALMTADVHWLETTPGDSKSVADYLDKLNRADAQADKQPITLPEAKDRGRRNPSFLGSLFSVTLLTLLFATAIPLDIPSSMADADESAIRIAVDAKGKLEEAEIPEGVVLPPGADAEKIFGGEHFPISIRLIVDGETLLEKTYEASGLSGNGRIAGMEFIPISSGTHQVEILVKDDDQDFRTAYSGEVTVEKAKVLLFYYNERLGVFEAR
ncbi:MAG: cytochrome b N-terminal domain-containing protein [Chloroflexi bacterium]|nr:cytochrome b N-terminal domain-containing protein [Chloroflexota bacterium]